MFGKLISVAVVSGVGLAATGVGLMMYSHKRSCDSLTTWNKLSNEIDKRDIRRYTHKELKQVVGKTTSDKWTGSQVEQLDQMYKTRQAKCFEEWDEENKRMEKDMEENPDKFPGIMKLIRMGPPDIYVTSNPGTNQRGEYYNSFKLLDEECDEDEYSQDELLMHRNCENKMLSNIIVD